MTGPRRFDARRGWAMPSSRAPDFEPSQAAAHARLEAVRPADYARTRNHLGGAVSRLSPYITHGMLTLPEVYRAVDGRHRIGPQHKFTYELGWREFFHHQWSRLGDGIFASLRGGPLPDDAYSDELPADLIEARTGLPVIDRAVEALYATGWLHNHARMWLASYTVHLRKVHWRAGADWMYGHLLDGDLASNHLSWQWVAGTASHKPYLFNAENVARYAPPEWHAPGTVIDCSYEDLDRIARDPSFVGEAGGPSGAGRIAKAGLGADVGGGGKTDGQGIEQPSFAATPPVEIAPAEPDALVGHWLIHPWAIRPSPAGRSAIGVLYAPFHRRWPWSERRWRFVLTAMAEVCERIVWCEAIAPVGLDALVETTGDPHLGMGAFASASARHPRLFDWPARDCRSFSEFWRLTRLVQV